MDAKNRSKSWEIIDGELQCVYGRARREAGQFEVYSTKKKTNPPTGGVRSFFFAYLVRNVQNLFFRTRYADLGLRLFRDIEYCNFEFVLATRLMWRWWWRMCWSRRYCTALGNPGDFGSAARLRLRDRAPSARSSDPQRRYTSACCLGHRCRAAPVGSLWRLWGSHHLAVCRCCT